MKYSFVAAYLLATASNFSLAQTSNEDRIIVIARQPDYLHHLRDALPVTIIDSDFASGAGSGANFLVQAPQINFNGQGGLLQTVSLRGLSRWRILTLVEGIPINTERRAGNAAEFIPPGMLGRAYVLPGAASTQLGSGALGGGIDLRLASTLDTQLTLTAGAQQDYRELQVLGGQDNGAHSLYWGFNTRHANNGEDANGNELIDGFDQTAGWVRYESAQGAVKDALFLVSQANKIGKASADPVDERITLYPDNDHWLAKLSFHWFNATVYAHQSDLETDVLRPQRRRNELHNEALNWGASLGDTFTLGSLPINWKFMLDARDSVEATERESQVQGEINFDRTNLSAQQRAWALAADTVNRVDNWQWATGGRIEYQDQDNRVVGGQRRSDTNVSGFVSLKRYWTAGWSAGTYISSAYRVPSLTERYFSGSTPRGTTLGDAALETERAINIEIDVTYQNDNKSLAFSAFRQQIDNYIERVALSDSLQQYVNLGDATIEGVNYSARWTMKNGHYLDINGQWLWGEDNRGVPVNDISPHQHSIQWGFLTHSADMWINLSYREQHDRPGTSELEIPSTAFVSAGYAQQLTPDLSLNLLLNNLTDRSYPVSTDDLSPQALGRDLQLSVTYTF